MSNVLRGPWSRPEPEPESQPGLPAVVQSAAFAGMLDRAIVSVPPGQQAEVRTMVLDLRRLVDPRARCRICYDPSLDGGLCSRCRRQESDLR